MIRRLFDLFHLSPLIPMNPQNWKTSAICFSIALISCSQVYGANLEEQKLLSGTLNIQISGLRSKKGTLRIGLFNSKETFSKKGKAIRSAVVKPNSREAVTSFKELPYGYYAISLYHDENNNDKYNLGLVLISRERYGFSNNVKPGLRGAPSFETAMFLMNSNEQVVTIKLH